MLRRLLVLVFILANLTTQVGVAYSCRMMGGPAKVQKHCCCTPAEARPMGKATLEAAACCLAVIQIPDGPGDQVANVEATAKTPGSDFQLLAPALVPVLLSLVLETRPPPLVRERSEASSSSGTDLYLRTQRLRL